MRTQIDIRHGRFKRVSARLNGGHELGVHPAMARLLAAPMALLRGRLTVQAFGVPINGEKDRPAGGTF